MGSNSQASSGGIRFCLLTMSLGWLTSLFIGLKLMDKITWSWLWVLSPLWILLMAVDVVALAIGVGYVVVDIGRYFSRLKAKAARKVRVISPGNKIDAEFASSEKGITHGNRKGH